MSIMQYLQYIYIYDRGSFRENFALEAEMVFGPF